METREFETVLSGIQAKVTETGGYTETSEVNGSSYYGRGNRSAWLTLRIPADKLDTFVTTVSGLGNVTSKSESVEDITLQYVDTESHKKALETEQDRLLTIMEQAESMDDIIKNRKPACQKSVTNCKPMKPLYAPTTTRSPTALSTSISTK